MYYFIFQIGNNADGSRESYSPNWHGRMGKCPKDVIVDLCNDKEGWGIAHTPDTFVPKEVKVITEIEAKQILDTVKDEDGVFFGQKLADRWLPKAIKEDIEDTKESLEKASSPPRIAVDTFLKICPGCRKTVAYVIKYDDGSFAISQEGKTLIKGIIAKEINMTCPNLHRVKVVLNGG